MQRNGLFNSIGVIICTLCCLLLVTVDIHAEEIKDIQLYYNFLNESISFDYDDEWFELSPTEYSQELAVTSMGLAISTFCAPRGEGGELSDGVEKLLKDMHFENIYYNDYYNEPTKPDGCAVAIGSKMIGDSALIAVAVRGGRYGLEWSSNFTVGENGTDHLGFSSARDNVWEEVENYIDKNVSADSVKLWITGFSRGAAVANLLAAHATDIYSRENVYSYCFETPANTTVSEPTVGYENIFNIIDPNDLVPKIPPALWGFTRYGRNVYIPEKGVNPEYDVYYEDYLREFSINTGMDIGASLPEDDMQFEVVNRCLTVLSKIMKNRLNYSLFYQDIITGLIEKGTEGIDYYQLFVILYQAYNDIMLDETGEFNTKTLENGFMYLVDHFMEFGSTLLNHTPVIVLSWMKALEATDVMASCIEDNAAVNVDDFSACYLRIYGDANIEFLEGENTAEGISGYIDEESTHVFLIPWGKKVKLVLSAEKESDIYLSMSSYALDTAVCNKMVDYGIKLKDKQTAELDVASGDKGSDFRISLASKDVRYLYSELCGDDAKFFLPYDRREELDWKAAEKESETEYESETEPETEKEIETETEKQTEIEAETEQKTQAETLIETATESITENETQNSDVKAAEDKTIALTIIAVAGVAGVVIIAAVITVFAKKKKKK